MHRVHSKRANRLAFSLADEVILPYNKDRHIHNRFKPKKTKNEWRKQKYGTGMDRQRERGSRDHINKKRFKNQGKTRRIAYRFFFYIMMMVIIIIGFVQSAPWNTRYVFLCNARSRWYENCLFMWSSLKLKEENNALRYPMIHICILLFSCRFKLNNIEYRAYFTLIIYVLDHF